MRLKGKTAIVTGAGRGLGRATAIAFAREGAKLAIISRTESELQEVGEIIHTLNGDGEYLLFPGDVFSKIVVNRFINEALKHFSRVDVLVNNAGEIGPPRFIEDTDANEWRSVLGANLNGVYYCTKAVLPSMIRSGGGKIINIGSGLGSRPFSRFCAYGVSKAGVIQLTRMLAEELREQNIQINAIDPGVMDTSMMQEIRDMGPKLLGEDIYQRMVDFKEKGILRKPEEVAPLAVFLASDNSNHLTGHFGSLDYFREHGWNG